jgi:hypothetical protein
VRQPALSIRKVLVALGALSVLVAIGLAGFALFGTQHQLEARARMVMLEQALQNHNSADIRADVLRAVLRSVGFNKEDDVGWSRWSSMLWLPRPCHQRAWNWKLPKPR